MRYWAKYRKDHISGVGRIHLLPCHLLDVAAVGYLMVTNNLFGAADTLKIAFARDAPAGPAGRVLYLRTQEAAYPGPDVPGQGGAPFIQQADRLRRQLLQ